MEMGKRVRKPNLRPPLSSSARVDCSRRRERPFGKRRRSRVYSLLLTSLPLAFGAVACPKCDPSLASPQRRSGNGALSSKSKCCTLTPLQRNRLDDLPLSLSRSLNHKCSAIAREGNTERSSWRYFDLTPSSQWS